MMKLSQHAYEVVNSFKQSLDETQRQALQDENFEELQMLIEAAIGSSVSRALHDLAKELELLAKKTRQAGASLEKIDK
ncbi:MAG: hypothetical protein JXR44_01260 [Thiotrichales bacterium]|nr:hypothetical protein [Thiotrichales bacterium]